MTSLPVLIESDDIIRGRAPRCHLIGRWASGAPCVSNHGLHHLPLLRTHLQEVTRLRQEASAGPLVTVTPTLRSSLNSPAIDTNSPPSKRITCKPTRLSAPLKGQRSALASLEEKRTHGSRHPAGVAAAHVGRQVGQLPRPTQAPGGDPAQHGRLEGSGRVQTTKGPLSGTKSR